MSVCRDHLLVGFVAICVLAGCGGPQHDTPPSTALEDAASAVESSASGDALGLVFDTRVAAGDPAEIAAMDEASRADFAAALRSARLVASEPGRWTYEIRLPARDGRPVVTGNIWIVEDEGALKVRLAP